MKLFLVIGVVVIILMSCSKNYANDSAYLGLWKSSSDSNSMVFAECLDFIEFYENWKYEVYNDCYAIDIINPIVEKGSWYTDKNQLIILHRKRLTNYDFTKSSVFETLKNNADEIIIKSEYGLNYFLKTDI